MVRNTLKGVPECRGNDRERLHGVRSPEDAWLSASEHRLMFDRDGVLRVQVGYVRARVYGRSLDVEREEGPKGLI